MTRQTDIPEWETLLAHAALLQTKIPAAIAAALERMDELYAEFKDEAGDLLTAVAVKLSLPDPYDLTDIDLSEYKGIVAPWNNWRAVQAQCASLAAALMTAPQ